MSKQSLTMGLIISVLFNAFLLFKKSLVTNEFITQTVSKTEKTREPSAIRKIPMIKFPEVASSTTVPVEREKNSITESSKQKTLELKNGQACTTEMLIPTDPTKEEVVKMCNEGKMFCTFYKENLIDEKSMKRIVKSFNMKKQDKRIRLQLLAQKIISEAYKKIDQMAEAGFSEADQDAVLLAAEQEENDVFNQIEKIKDTAFWNEHNYCYEYDHCVILE